MKIQGIYIQEAGPHRNVHIEASAFSSPITVIYGQNEAGKSSIHAFIRMMMFAQRKSRKRYSSFSSFELNEIAGTLSLLTTHDQMWTVHQSRKGGSRRRVEIRDEDGAPVAEPLFYQAFGGISEALYANLYAISLHELQRLDLLKMDEIASLFYRTSRGAQTMTILDLEKKMQEGMDALFRPRASLPEINQTLSRLEEWQAKSSAFTRMEEEYEPLQKKRQLLNKEKENVELKLKKVREEIRLLQTAMQLKEWQDDREELERELQALEERQNSFILYEVEMDQLQMEQARMESMEKDTAQLKEELNQTEKKIRLRIEYLGIKQSISDFRFFSIDLPYKDRCLSLARDIEENQARLKEMEKELEKYKSEWLELDLEDSDDQDGQQHDQYDQHHDQYDQHDQHDQHLYQPTESNQSPLSNRSRSEKNDAHPVLPLFIGAGGLIGAIFLWMINRIELAVMTGVLMSILAWTSFHLRTQHIRLETEKKEWQQRWSQQQNHELEQYRQITRRRKETLLLKQEGIKKECVLLRSKIEGFLHELKRMLDSFHLKGPMSVKALEEWFQYLEWTKEEDQRYQRLQGKLQSLEIETESWRNRVFSIASKAGIVPAQPSHSPFVILQVMLEKLQKEKNAVQRAEQVKQEASRLRQMIEEKLEQQPALIQSNRLDLAIEEMERQLEELQTRLGQYQKELDQIHIETGQVEHHLHDLEQKASQSTIAQEIEEHKSDLRDQARKWAAYALARKVCEKVRQVYEEEKQPKVIQKASQIFATMTAGRYKRLIAPLGQQDIQAVLSTGERLETRQLSQGTREQLYLALRFAMILTHSADSRLPVLLDDIFVNFDPQRLELAISSLKQLAPEHQILLFTCHPHILKACKHVFEDVQVVNLQAVSERGTEQGIETLLTAERKENDSQEENRSVAN